MVAVTLGLVAVGCTNREPGDATPAGETPMTSSATSAAPEKSRPREVKLDGIDPCKVLTAEQMKELAVVEAERNDGDIVKAGDEPVCAYDNNDSPRVTYEVGLVTSKGIEYWRGTGNVAVERIEVGGYPAVQLTFKGTSTVDCGVSVDVAEGQQLYVDFSSIGQTPSQEQMCDNAKKAAELALVTLPTLA
ncbi:uncharacterized protein DUF3558 [Saccharothrix saharensis]|uniref:Uncharacterized protein DUF3558 n=1 Tax=Saccharothrix saharensis TaxID=571190 RepID=A0A543JH60_9PSEU|nr:DUF3558 domain-containing protein [Saccharothrix saharensis]TQM82162.1 uncharacterized protein DUF3558 [Saccharothrix saharensis]